MTAATAAPQADLSRQTAWLVLGALFLLHVAFAVVFWDKTWDDSAITLAFSRTLAQTGTVAATPLSDPVEGYSTTLWMLLHAGLAALGLGPGALLTTAKLLALALNGVSFALLYRLAGRHLDRRSTALAVTAAYATLSAALFESVNGMETPLFVAVFLAALLLLWPARTVRQRLAFLLATTAFLLVRWEAAWYLVPFALVWLRRDGLRALLRPEVIAWAAVFALTTLWRWTAFGALVPNTILAKRLPPYSPDLPLFPTLVSHAKPLVAFALALLPLAAVVVFAWRRLGRVWLAPWSLPRGRHFLLLALIVAAGVVFNAVVGVNWGPKNRMMLVAFPAALLLLGRAFEVVQGGVRLLWAAVALGAMLNMGYAVWAAQGFLISASEVRRVAEAVERVRVTAGRERLTYAGPDMGAVLLYRGDPLRVLDLGLLCDPVLTREGWAATPDYLYRRERPDLIETHWWWTTLGGFPRHTPLRSDYEVLFVDGFRFFARRDLVADLRARGARLRPARFDREGNTPAYDATHFAFEAHLPDDFALNRAFGSYSVLEDRPQP